MTREERKRADRIARWEMAALIALLGLGFWLAVALRDALAAAMW